MEGIDAKSEPTMQRDTSKRIQLVFNEGSSLFDILCCQTTPWREGRGVLCVCVNKEEKRVRVRVRATVTVKVMVIVMVWVWGSVRVRVGGGEGGSS
jgi:hypothetical protein